MRISAATAGLMVIVVAGLALFGVVRLGWLAPFQHQNRSEVGLTVVQSMRELSALTTIEQVQYTTVEQTKSGGFLGSLRSDRVFLFAVARIGAGVDLANVGASDVQVDQELHSVRLTLPAPTIQYVAMDNDATRVYDRDTGIFTSADKTLETQARQAAEAELRQKALSSGILDRAQDNAVHTLSVFLRSLGYTHIDIVVRTD